MTDRFPYETSKWGESDEERKAWYEGLEKFGVEAVRAHLVKLPFEVGANSSVALTKPAVKIGFAWEWVSWRDDNKAKAEERREARMEKRRAIPRRLRKPPLGPPACQPPRPPCKPSQPSLKP
jgi:hypothetical protein